MSKRLWNGLVTAFAAMAWTGILGVAYASTTTQSISVSFENRTGAVGRGCATKNSALYVALGYESKSPNMDTSFHVRKHPAGSNDCNDTASISANVEREFAIGNRKHLYHAVNLGYDRHGLSVIGKDGEAYFGSVDAPSAAWVVGVKGKHGELDVGYDAFAEGPKLTANTTLMGVSLSADIVKIRSAGEQSDCPPDENGNYETVGSSGTDRVQCGQTNGVYAEFSASYTVGNARFYWQRQTGLNHLSDANWKLGKDGKTPCPGTACSTPPYSDSVGIAYVKSF